MNGQRRSDATVLLPQHQTLIIASGISPEVAQARGYRSVTSISELRRLGFGELQCSVPTLLIPVRNVHGEVAMYQSRPDAPRVLKGKPIKYETPAGARMVVDVPPPVRDWLRDPMWPLFITEGIRKADAAVSRGLCCIALLGVWNWRGTNELGGKAALPDWEAIPLNGRPVFVVFDSDLMIKPQVHAALARFKAFLESRHAKVLLIYLPNAEDGSKVGLDDYLAAGHDVDDLLALATIDLRSIPVEGDPQAPSGPYEVVDGRICCVRETKYGTVNVPLCNFVASVVEEVELDDGVETSRAYLLDGTLASGERLPMARVPTESFGTLSWVPTNWGLRAVVAAGFSTRDKLREAIQLLSPEAPRRRVFTHTGWRKIDSRWIYLTAGGAVGEEGFEVDLGTELRRYSLPSLAVDPVEAMRRSLNLLQVAPLCVTAPLWSSVFRAPLAAALAPDLTVWLEGMTGSLKSSLAAVFLSHWGEFDRLCLPGAWSSTPNQLEKRAFILKDLLFVIDEYAPTAHDARELDSKAARLIRGQGNRAGRGRLRADLSERPTYSPRGLLLGTGEHHPSGQSVLARMLVIEVERSQIDLKLLSAAQSNAARLPHAMSGYVSWLAPQMDSLTSTLRGTFEALRGQAVAGSSHLRMPEVLAHLGVGLDCGLAYATEIGACDNSEAEDLRARCWTAMVELVGAQAKLVEEERPTRRFLETLAALVLQRRIVLIPRDSSPEGLRPETGFVGWEDDQFLYLQAEAAFQAVSRFCRDAGEAFPVSQGKLRRDLVRERIAQPDPGRLTAMVRLGRSPRRVLRLCRSAVEEVLGEAFPTSLPGVSGVSSCER